MPIISFTQKDLLRGKVVTPGWYRVRIDSVGEAPSKDQKSTNYPVESTIVMNADNGDKEFENVPIDWMFNSKWIKPAADFLKCFGVDVQAGARFDLGKTAGQEIDVFIENSEYEGRIQNKVNHKYRQAQE